MARQQTITAVHRAALELAVAEDGGAPLTMEGIARRAGVGKQTLYRSWPSPGAIVFDALLARDQAGDGTAVIPDSGDLARDLAEHVRQSIEEIHAPPREPLLRRLATQIVADPVLAREFRERLHEPQLRSLRDRVAAGGIAQPEEAVEMLLAPVVYRWLLRAEPMADADIRRHVTTVLRAFAPHPGRGA